MHKGSQKYLSLFLLSWESVERKAFPQDLKLKYNHDDYKAGNSVLMQSLTRQQLAGEATDSTAVG